MKQYMKKWRNLAEKKWLRRMAACLFWLCVWQSVFLLADNKLLLAGPIQTAQALFCRIFTFAFWQVTGMSLFRVLLGLFLAFFVGTLLGIAAFKSSLMKELLSPLMLFCKAVPVASFAVILLIWWGSGWLSTAVIFPVVLPMVYVNIYEGLKSTDKKLLQMAKVFDMPLRNRIFYIHMPSLAPFMDGCIKTAVGMGIKAGVAAEVIGTPVWSVGGELYLSKIYLDTAGVFAWTAVVIALGFALEKAVLFCWRSFCRRHPEPVKGRKKEAVPASIYIEDVVKSFGSHTVLCGISKKLEAGRIYCLTGVSGAGKTTLLHILAGLEKPGQGRVEMHAGGNSKSAISAAGMFQDDRLCEEETALVNVRLVSHDCKKAEECLKELLPEEAFRQPVKNLSGGMRRRVCLARALTADADWLFLDEPFTALDEENKQNAIHIIKKYRQNKLTVLVTHDINDAAKLGGEIWKI